MAVIVVRPDSALERWSGTGPTTRAFNTAVAGDRIMLTSGIYRARPRGYSQAHIRKVIKQLSRARANE